MSQGEDSYPCQGPECMMWIQTQDNNPLSPDEAAASLAFATNLSENFMPQAPEAPTSPGNEPGTQENPASQEDVKTEISGLETRFCFN